MLTGVIVCHSWDDRGSLVDGRETELVGSDAGWSFTKRRWASSRVGGRMNAEPAKDSFKECLTTSHSLSGRHAAALALLGWYLMLPPGRGQKLSRGASLYGRRFLNGSTA